ncbi:carbon monoxide dehydrogenase, partial [Streptomyces sp. NPDC055078]
MSEAEQSREPQRDKSTDLKPEEPRGGSGEPTGGANADAPGADSSDVRPRAGSDADADAPSGAEAGP